MKTSTKCLAILSGVFLLAPVACADISEDEQDVADAQQAVSGAATYHDCTTARKQAIEDGIDYLYWRVTDGELALGECMSSSYLWENKKLTGREIAKLLQLPVITDITCADLPSGPGWVTNGEAPVNITGERLTLDNNFVTNNGTRRIASLIAHEIMHNRSFRHNDSVHYSNSVPEQIEACIRNWTPNAAADTGYALFWDGDRVGYESGWSLASAKTNCQWNKDTYHPGKLIECFYNGTRFGYELFHDGKRVGFEPNWSLASAKTNCQWNKDTYHPAKRVECVYNGKPLGYELFHDGKRVGFEPNWSLASGKNNCQSNKDAYHPAKRVECFYNGSHVGYQLYHDGRRVGLEPKWTRAQADSNCAWNRSKYDATKVVECSFDGSQI